jgi:hypothetical protein
LVFARPVVAEAPLVVFGLVAAVAPPPPPQAATANTLKATSKVPLRVVRMLLRVMVVVVLG